MATKQAYMDWKNLLPFVGNFTATATGTGGTSTATLNRPVGVITTDAITTAAGATHVMTITNNRVAAGDIAHVTVVGGTFTAGIPVLKTVTTANTITLSITNAAAAAAVNGNIKVAFAVYKIS
jgi:hypothetical protein